MVCDVYAQKLINISVGCDDIHKHWLALLLVCSEIKSQNGLIPSEYNLFMVEYGCWCRQWR